VKFIPSPHLSRSRERKRRALSSTTDELSGSRKFHR
jgi:hypothetical protein